MNPNSLIRNRRLRELLANRDLLVAGSRAHAERVAVYSVAVGERHGYDDARLTDLRIAAELHDFDSDALMEFAIDVDDRGKAIIRLCEEFDARRLGFHGQIEFGELVAATWLRANAPNEYEVSLVKALLDVQSIIQPIGT